MNQPTAPQPERSTAMPRWWQQRRLGLFVHANLATVPAWSPVGQYSEWYWSHLTGDRPDAIAHEGALAEVVAHHQDRWGHVDDFDDFLPLLTFDRFDAEEWARLAVDAGMGYAVHVTKHHDGWCWWDAPNTDRTFVNGGPKRNVVSEFAAACERNDIVFGTYYSLLDWGDDRYPSNDYVREVLHAHVRDLVARHGTAFLWGDGHWGKQADHWGARELLEELRAADPDLVVNDRWGVGDSDGTGPIVRTFEYEPPDDITPGPWELCRGVGWSFGYNRAEREEHHMTAADIVALYTEVLAKGGNLLLNVGPALDGTIPELQAAPLRAAGEWIRPRTELLSSATPWETWGSHDQRFFTAATEAATTDGTQRVYAVDLTGTGTLSGIDPQRWKVHEAYVVDDATRSPTSVHQHSDGTLDVDCRGRIPRTGVRAVVLELSLSPVDAPIELFTPEDAAPKPLAPLLAAAQPGDIVQLGDGMYAGPAEVPPAVVVRGLGPDRTRIDGGGTLALTLGRGSRIEHLTVEGCGERVAWLPATAVRLAGNGSSVLGADIAGHIHVAADECTIRATTAYGITAREVRNATISRCRLHGNRWDVGIDLRGGEGHTVESTSISNHLAAISLRDTTGPAVRGNSISARWWGVRLQRTERAHIHGNRVDHTMRAVDVDGGHGAIVDGNAVSDGDSGCLVQSGASACIVSGNYWERCRIGLLGWEVTGLHDVDNVCVDLDDCARIVTDAS